MNGEGMQKPPAEGIFTLNAPICAPICAAEITHRNGVRTVEWIYLKHATGTSLPRNVAKLASNPANVWICMMLNAEHSPLDASRDRFHNHYSVALDPEDIIPQSNALLLHGYFGKLYISSEAYVGV